MRQTSIQMELMTGRDKAADDCLCCIGVDNCLSHGPNSVCFVIQEESEPASGSVHSCGQEQIEKTVRCDMIIKYRQKVKVIRRELSKDEMCSENNDVAEIFQDDRDVTNVDHMVPEVIVKKYGAELSTMSLGESTNISQLKVCGKKDDLIASLPKGSALQSSPLCNRFPKNPSKSTKSKLIQSSF